MSCHFRPLAAASVIAGILVATSSLAENDPSTIAFETGPLLAHSSHPPETIVVIGHRPEDAGLTVPDINEARQRIELTPGGIDLIDARQFRAGRASTLDDALKFSPGVFVQPRFGADEARLSIRGSGIQRTFHLRGIKLLQDGVMLNQADGGGDFQAIELLAARYIEVYRGANALQYGASTLGGALNFVSPTGYDTPGFTGRLSAGSFDSTRMQAAFAGHGDSYDWYGSLSHSEQEGFRDHARQNNTRFFGNAGLRIAAGLETRVYLAWVDTRSELPGNLTKAELESNPRLAAPGNLIGNQKRDFTLWRIASKTTWALHEGRLELSAFYAEKELFHPIFQVLDIDYRDYGAELRYVSEAPLAGRKNLLTVGIAPSRGTARDIRHLNMGGERGALSGDSEQTATNLDVYIENQLYILPATALIVGAQYTGAKRAFDDYFLTNGDNSFDVSYHRASPKLGVRHELSPDIQLFANWSGSTEPPSFGELSGGPGITQVRAQRASTIELGSRGSAGAVRWNVSAYRAKVEDELLGLNDAMGLPLGTINAPRTLHQGIEAGLEWNIAPGWTLRQAYTLNDFRFDDHPVYGNNRLPGVPRQFYVAELAWKDDDGWFAAPNVTWSPQSHAVDMANSLYADDYAVWGFKFGRQIAGGLARGLSWFIEGKNLTDGKYAAATGVIADAKGMDQRQFLPGDGRSVYAGIEWRY